jgi:hypothetical protein
LAENPGTAFPGRGPRDGLGAGSRLMRYSLPVTDSVAPTRSGTRTTLPRSSPSPTAAPLPAMSNFVRAQRGYSSDDKANALGTPRPKILFWA